MRQELIRLENDLSEATRKLQELQREDAMWHSFQGTSFGGVPMAQYWVDLVLWESVLNINPELKQIIEIGTWKGGFSAWLLAQARTRDMRFTTYDVVRDEALPNAVSLEFTRKDVFADPGWVAAEIEYHGPTVLFCDGGNKPRELKTFSPYLKDPRSLVAVHDWGTETQPEDVPDGLEMLYEKQFKDMGSITRFFKVKNAT